MSMTEQEARRLVAAEYERDGHSHAGRVLRWGLRSLPYGDRIAIRALMGERPAMAEQSLRSITKDAIADFCACHGFPVPELTEERVGQQVRFSGTAPDGRRFALAYELDREAKP